MSVSDKLPAPAKAGVDTGFVVRHAESQRGRVCLAILPSSDRLYVTATLGFDVCIDRTAPDIAAQLAAACPKGIDVYFELTGGRVFDAVLPLLNPFAWVPVCGTIATRNATRLPDGPDRTPLLLGTILTQSLTFRGFIVSEFQGDAPEFTTRMAAWLTAGHIRYREDVTQGLDRMVDAFIGMLDGCNFGKTLIRLAD